MFDLLIKDAAIIDGSGAPPFVGSVGVTGERISLICRGKCTAAARAVISGEGLICSPGFIDAHSHADLSIPLYPEAYNLVTQGITTFAGGNCGIGLAPAMNPGFYRPYHESLDLGDIDVSWKTFGQWLDFARTLPLGANYAPLVGLNPIRGSVLGADYHRHATGREIAGQAELLHEALDAGAFGLSFSLDPGTAGHFASQKELDVLFAILDEREVLLTAHTRHHQNQWPSNDGKTFYGWFAGYSAEAICGRYQGLVEFMEYYRRFPRLRSMIAHLTNAFGVPQPHSLALEYAMLDETVELLVDRPNREGCDVYFNAIPDTQSIAAAHRVATALVRNMPFDDSVKGYAFEDKMIDGLKGRAFREKMKAFINGGRCKITMLHPATDPYWAADYVFVSGKNPALPGKTLMDVTLERMPGTQREILYNNCLEVLFDLLEEDPQLQGAMALDKREFATERMLLNPRGIPITDCISLPAKPDLSRNIMGYGTPPIAYSIFVRFLINNCRDNQTMPMQEAFRRLTSLPAHVLRIPDRGLLKEGYFADVTLLDWQALAYQNDFTQPAKPSCGIEHVIVGGTPAVKDGAATGNPAGKVLSRRA